MDKKVQEYLEHILRYYKNKYPDNPHHSFTVEEDGVLNINLFIADKRWAFALIAEDNLSVEDFIKDIDEGIEEYISHQL